MIDWVSTQRRLGVSADGIAGPITYAELIEHVASPEALSANIADVAAFLAKHAGAYGMTTPARLAEFVAQIANETGGFEAWSENLNYKPASMLKTWPAHFTAALADLCVGKPQRVAEVAYGIWSKKGVGRMGNTEPGDGWRYRGRGALQLTGKDNYRAYGQRLGLDLLAAPDKAAEPATSVLIALEFFRVGRVNDAVDRGDFREARRITNGGAIGLEHVAALRAKLLAVLS